jgi:hypothetical protein
MPVGLYNQPYRNADQAAYENPNAAHGQSNTASKPLQVDCGWKTSSVVSISEQGQRSAGIQKVEPKVLSAAEEAVYVEQLKNAYIEQCVSPAYNKHGYNYRSPDRVGNDIRQHDREATEWAYKKINAPEPCQTFELSMTKENKQDNIVSDVSTSSTWFGISMKSFSEYYQRHADPYTVKIKEVSWQWNDYNNGADRNIVKLFYTEPATTPSRDNPVDISEKSIGSTQYFNNLRFGPMAHFEMLHQLEGGTFPAKRPEMPAMLTIKYQYQTKSCHNPSMPRYHHDDL